MHVDCRAKLDGPYDSRLPPMILGVILIVVLAIVLAGSVAEYIKLGHTWRSDHDSNSKSLDWSPQTSKLTVYYSYWIFKWPWQFCVFRFLCESCIRLQELRSLGWKWVGSRFENGWSENNCYLHVETLGHWIPIASFWFTQLWHATDPWCASCIMPCMTIVTADAVRLNIPFRTGRRLHQKSPFGLLVSWSIWRTQASSLATKIVTLLLPWFDFRPSSVTYSTAVRSYSLGMSLLHTRNINN